MPRIRFDDKDRPNVKILVVLCESKPVDFASKLNLLLQQGIPKSRFHRRFAWFRKSGLGLVLLRYLKRLLSDPIPGHKYMGMID